MDDIALITEELTLALLFEEDPPIALTETSLEAALLRVRTMTLVQEALIMDPSSGAGVMIRQRLYMNGMGHMQYKLERSRDGGVTWTWP